MNNNLSPLQALTAARELLSDPTKWTKRYYAQDKTLHAVDILSEDASCFCSVGALCKVNGVSTEAYNRMSGSLLPGRDILTEAANKLADGMDDLERASEIAGPVDVNDLLGHKHVLQMFDIAIEMAQSNEPVSEDHLA